MRTTVTLDDALLNRAMEISGITDRTSLLNKALTELIHREASRRLAALGGTEPGITAPPRRRQEPVE